jgi:putative ATPase
LLSRCRVFVLEKLGEEAIYRILLRALRVLNESNGGGGQDVTKQWKGKGKEVKREEEDSKPERESSQPTVHDEPSPSTSTPTITQPSPSSTADESILAYYPSLDSSLLRFLASAADGDARIALSSLELALSATKDGTTKVDREELKKGLRKAHLQYDRNGGKSPLPFITYTSNSI